MNILIIDDDEMVLEMINFVLSKEGYRLVKCSNSSLAMKLIESENIDLVICDVMMPLVSGIMLYNLIKQSNEINVPIILMTSFNDLQEIRETLNITRDHIIKKPINFDELKIKIGELANEFK